MVCIFSSSLLGLYDNNELTVNESELKLNNNLLLGVGRLVVSGEICFDVHSGFWSISISRTEAI